MSRFGYKSTKTGFSIGTAFEQYEDIYISPGLSASYEDIEVQSDASSRIKKMDGTYSNVNFDYGIIVDKRNQPFQPTSGYRTKFAQSLPIIIDSSSLANLLEFSAYHAITDDVIGSLKLIFFSSISCIAATATIGFVIDQIL